MKEVRGSLSGRVALVTGAGSGIGRATARLLCRAGARVALLGRDRRELEAAAAGLRRAGAGKAAAPLILEADVSDPGATEAALARLERAWRRLDIVVANAGINGVWAPLEEIDPAEWDRTLDVNLRGAFLTIRGALPLLKRRGGAIVVTSSINGTRAFGNPGATAYACSKAAQVTLVKMLAVELGPHRIRINAVCPGTIATNIAGSTRKRHLASLRAPSAPPGRRIPLTGDEPGTADAVAALAWFLASDLAGHITGTEVFIDGAQSLCQG